MTRVLVTGGMGMLGHVLVDTLRRRYTVGTTVRDAAPTAPYPLDGVTVLTAVDLTREDSLHRVLDVQPWDVLVNAVGMIKQRDEATDPVRTIAANALLPHRLAAACRERGIRLIHFSTDCVFSGSPASVRGPLGYRESDPTDAQDLYGLSKRLGEPVGPGCLSLRTSIIGPELRGRHGLLAWFLGQDQPTVRGFTQALFTGITTTVAAELVARLIDEHAALSGLYHVAAEPISKHELLRMFGARWRPQVQIEPDDSVVCDRRLDGRRFQAQTGWSAPAWPAMIDTLRVDA